MVVKLFIFDENPTGWKHRRYAIYFYKCTCGISVYTIVAPFCRFIVLEYYYLTSLQEVGWDSDKPGYDGLIEVANRLMMKGRTKNDTVEAAVFLFV